MKSDVFMITDRPLLNFLSAYDEEIIALVGELRSVLLKNLPDIIEQLDHAAKMIAYTYGQKYAELVCVIIPSKKGVKLGFNKGNELPDPHGLLQGTGKVSRYIEIKSVEQVKSKEIKQMIVAGLKLYKVRMKK